jgi:hypothetical protein
MFGPVIEAVRGRFSSDEGVIGTVQNWLRRGGGGTLKRLNRCIEVEWDYVEKRY